MKTIKRHRRRWLLSLSGLIVALVVSIGVVQAAGEQLGRSLTSGGGGQASQSGLTLHSAVGQPAIGGASSSINLCSGYLCGPGAPETSAGQERIYLPVVIK
jgi:hypothetical protein